MKIPPKFTGSLKTLVSKDGDTLIVKLQTTEGEIAFAIDIGMTELLLNRIAGAADTAARRMHETQEKGANAARLEMMAAASPTHYGVGAAVDGQGIGLMFHAAGAPVTYLLSDAQAEDIARALLDQLSGNGVKPPRKN